MTKIGKSSHTLPARYPIRSDAVKYHGWWAKSENRSRWLVYTATDDHQQMQNQKESSLPTIHFQQAMLVLGENLNQYVNFLGL